MQGREVGLRGLVVALVVVLGIPLAVGVWWAAREAQPNPRLVDGADAVEQHAFSYGVAVGPAGDVGLVEPAEGFDLRVSWSAGPCHLSPTVEVRPAGEAGLRIVVSRGPLVVAPGEDCPDLGVHHAVDLQLAPWVEAEQVSTVLVAD